VNPFSLIVGLGASLGLLRVLRVSPPATRLRWLTAGSITLAGALFGARAGFIIAYHQYYFAHTQEILHIDQGGLSWPGAVIGAILFAWLGLRFLGFWVSDGFDKISRMLLPAAAAIWLGAWLSGLAYGQALPGGTWWGMPTPDESGLVALRAPVQPAAILSLILALLICEWLTHNAKKKGVKAAWMLFAFSIHSLLFSFMRYDSVQHLFGLRLDSWAAMAITIFAIIVLSITLIKPLKGKAVEME